MKSYYDILQDIKTIINAEPFNNTVSSDDIGAIDLEKQNIYPLAHIDIDSGTIEENHVSFNVSIFFMDMIDFNKEESTDLINGNNNIQDVINTQFRLAYRVMRVLQKADLYRNDYQISSAPTFTKQIYNSLRGWSVSFQISTNGEMTYC